MTEVTPTPAPRSSPIWRSVVIAAVAVLAVGIGAVAGAFLLNARSAGAGAAAAYLPPDAAMFIEFRLPSTEQDVALRSIMERFPIPGFDPERPAVEQLTELIDEKIAESGEDFSYAEDVAPWWDGSVTFAYTDLVAASDPFSTEVPPMLALLGVTDATAARATVERLNDDFGEGGEVGSTEHRGVTIWTVDDPSEEVEWSYALTDDQLILASSIDELTAALDRHADGDASFATNEELQRLAADLPNDRLMFGVFSADAVFDAALEASDDDQAAAFYDGLRECGAQPTNAAMAMWATDDRLVFETVGDAPTGAFAVDNVDRRLAAQVPADALAYVEGGSIGSAYACMVTAFKDAFAGDPAAAEGLGQVEALLGSDLEELVSWIDGGAVAAGWDGSEPYAGTILVPSDADAARERVNGLLAFARLATLDGSLGISVDEEELDGVELTTIRWDGGSLIPELGMPGAPAVPTSLALQVAVGDELVIIGFGDRFATRVLELDEADSLAASDRFSAVVDELGGISSAGVAWWDLAGTREAVEGALGESGVLDELGEYETDVKPWLVPFDRMAAVARVDDDRLVQRAVLLFD
jgi:hypothetical protein